jgi:protein-tyrosine phosphatase
VNLADDVIQSWHRRLCEVTPWLAISGDLPEESGLAAAQLRQWVEAGITDIVDVRGEWSDEDFVARQAPQLRYWYLGTHDNGSAQHLSWFDAGIAALHRSEKEPNAKFMVHCHMGINRGPSMAYAYLLERGVGVTAALDAIRDARPIAAIAYADDALRAHCRRHGIAVEEQELLLAQQRQWFDDHEIDVRRVIRLLRSAS